MVLDIEYINGFMVELREDGRFGVCLEPANEEEVFFPVTVIKNTREEVDQYMEEVIASTEDLIYIDDVPGLDDPDALPFED